MGLIEKILEPKTLASLLLAVVIAGMVGGGLWINSLKDSLAEQKAIHAARSQLIEERYRTALVELSSEYETATSAFKKFKQDILDGIALIESSAVSLGVPRLPRTSPIPPGTTRQDVVVRTRALKLLVEQSKLPEAAKAERILRKLEDYRYPEYPERVGTSGGAPMLLPQIIALLIACILLWGVGRLFVWATGAISSALIRRSYLRRGVPLDSCIGQPMSVSDANHSILVRGLFGTKERRHWERLKSRLKETGAIHVFAVPYEAGVNFGADRGVIVLRGRRILGMLLEGAPMEPKGIKGGWKLK